MTAEVLILPGVERRDMCGEEVPAAEVLQSAIDKGVADVVIVGRNRDGSLYVAGSSSNIDQAIGMLMRAVNVMTGEVER